MDAIQKRLLTTQRLEPLSGKNTTLLSKEPSHTCVLIDKSTTALLKLLLCIHTMCEVDIDIKIIYQGLYLLLQFTMIVFFFFFLTFVTVTNIILRSVYYRSMPSLPHVLSRSTDSHLLLTNLNLLYIVLNSTTTFSLQGTPSLSVCDYS